MSNTIKLAATEMEREAIYRHRYDIYILELGKSHIPADHNRRMLADEADGSADLLYAILDGVVIGSTRMQRGASMLFSAVNKEMYQTVAISKALDPEKIVIVDRLMVRPEHRRSRVTTELMNNTYVCMLNKGIKLALINTEEKYLHLYLRFGFRVYGDPLYTALGEPRYRMALFLCDSRHLAKVNSPFLNYLPAAMDDQGAHFAAVRRLFGPCFVKCFRGFDKPICTCSRQIASSSSKTVSV
jgi:GNAT superfamily N-acetyltransferase